MNSGGNVLIGSNSPEEGRRQLWTTASDCIKLELEGSFNMTTCGWLATNGDWARGRVQYTGELTMVEVDLGQKTGV